MKSSDIPDEHVIELAQRFSDSRGTEPGVIDALVNEGVPAKLAWVKVERLCTRGLLEYGTTPRYAWPTGKH